jgi:hypothetical protein
MSLPISEISQEDLRAALLEIARQLMIKDNLIKTLVDLGGSMPIFRNSKFKVQN